jgi:glycosyltransferase involved in cell wall biosynthesis
MKISVVIPCKNEEQHIKQCLLSLLENGYSPSLLEILVVDGGSTDSTKSIVQDLITQFPQVRSIENPRGFTPFALNLGVFASTGEAILISSAHAAFDKGYIQSLQSALITLPNAIAVGGEMKTEIKHNTSVAIAIKTVLSHRFGVGNATFRTGVKEVTQVDTVPFGLYRAETLKSSGGYDERLIRNHDMELSKRLLKGGGAIYLTPHASCTYFCRETYRGLANNSFANGKWNLLTVWITRQFSSLSIRHFVPLLFILSVLCPLFLSLIYFPFLWISVAVLCLYLVSIVILSIRQTKASPLHLVIAFLTLHFSYGFGSLVAFTLLPNYFKHDIGKKV